MEELLVVLEDVAISGVILGVSVIIALVFSKVVKNYVMKIATKTQTKLDDYAIKIVKGPAAAFIILTGSVSAVHFWDSRHPGVLPELLTMSVDAINVVGIILVVTSFISLLLNEYLAGRLREIVKGSPDKETTFRALQRLAIYTVYFIGALAVLAILVPGGIGFLTGALIGAGFLAIVMGMAAQSVLGNFMSGLSINLTRPYRLGDAVVFKEEYGTVEEIAFRHTVIRTWDNRRLIIPNSAMDSEAITNYTIKDSRMLMPLLVGISYESDLDLAKRIMIEAAKAHPHCLPDMEPKVQLLDFGESAIQLRLLAMAKDQPSAFNMACDLREEIKHRFDREGIEIPYPRRYLIIGEDKRPPSSPEGRRDI